MGWEELGSPGQIHRAEVLQCTVHSQHRSSGEKILYTKKNKNKYGRKELMLNTLNVARERRGANTTTELM